MRNAALAALLALAACGFGINENEITITYAPPGLPFSPNFGTQSGNVPDVSCSSSNNCTGVPVPQGGTATCETATGKCMVQADVRLAKSINLSEQSDFPPQIAAAASISGVTVSQVRFWATSNTLTFDTPPIDVYVGPASIQRETDAGAVKVGTLPVIAAGSTACSEAAPCSMPITSDGGRALADRALDFKTPFALLTVAHVTARAGQKIPSGKADLLVQPELKFTIPLR